MGQMNRRQFVSPILVSLELFENLQLFNSLRRTTNMEWRGELILSRLLRIILAQMAPSLFRGLFSGQVLSMQHELCSNITCKIHLDIKPTEVHQLMLNR